MTALKRLLVMLVSLVALSGFAAGCIVENDGDGGDGEDTDVNVEDGGDGEDTDVFTGDGDDGDGGDTNVNVDQDNTDGNSTE